MTRAAAVMPTGFPSAAPETPRHRVGSLAIAAILGCVVAAPTRADPAMSAAAISPPAGGERPAEAPVATSVWQYAFYKTLTYETLANTADLLILNTLTAASATLGVMAPAPTTVGTSTLASATAVGTTTLGATFLAVDMASAAVTYYTHEIAWAFMGPAQEDRTTVTAGAKATGYRVLSLIRGYGLAYAYVGNASIATTYTILAGITHTALYLGNDWAWAQYAPPPQP